MGDTFMKEKTYTAEEIIEALGLVPLPKEGGLVLETYRSTALTREGEAAGTAIFYMLRGSSFSHLHRLKGDEMYHFYLGDPVELTELLPDGSVKKTVLVVLLTVFTMAVIWATIVLLFTISSQFVTMIREVYYEIVYRL